MKFNLIREQLYIQVLHMENPSDSISDKGASDVADTTPCGWSRCLESCLHMVVAALPGTSYAFSRLAQLTDGARMEPDGTGMYSRILCIDRQRSFIQIK